MKSYEKMANDALERADAYRTKRKQMILKTVVPLCGLCLVAAVTVFVGGRNTKPPVASPEGESKGTEISTSVITDEKISRDDNSAEQQKSNTQQTTTPDHSTGQSEFALPCIPYEPASAASVASCAMTQWHGKMVAENLFAELEKAEDDEVFKFRVSVGAPNDYVYEGKTVAQYQKEMENNWVREEKMSTLLKQGEMLKYGKALYEGGAPEKWAKEFYDERVEVYGDLLDQYIQNGVFLVDKLKADIEKGPNTQSYTEKLIAAKQAYTEKIAAEYGCEVSEGYMMMEFTKKAFIEFSCKGESMIFCSANPQSNDVTPAVETYNAASIDEWN